MRKNTISKQQMSFLPVDTSNTHNITLSEFLTSQTSIVAPGDSKLIKKLRPQDNVPYYVTQFDRIIADKQGRLRSVQMEIETHGKYLSTNDFDDAVFLAIQNLCLDRNNGEGERIIKTTNHEIIRKMNLSANGKVYEKLEESLDKLNTSTISSDYWIDHDTGKAIKESLPFLAVYKRERDESRTITEETDGVIRDVQVFYKPVFQVGLHEDYWRSLKDGEVLIDLDALALFKSKTKKNIFRFLNTVFSVNRSITLKLRELADVAGINPDTFSYESKLKQRIKSYLKDFEKEEVIEKVQKEDYIKCFDENRAIYYKVNLKAGKLYDDLSERFNCKPAHYDFFMKLREFKLPTRECIKIIDSHIEGTDEYIPGREFPHLEADINALRRILRVIPNEIEKPQAWLRNCVKQVPPWDHKSKLELIDILEKQKESLTAYQRSGKINLMNTQEYDQYTFLTQIASIASPVAKNFVRTHKYSDKIERLIRVFTQLSSEEQTPEFIVHMLKNDDSRIWREAIAGSEHAQQKEINLKAKSHSSSNTFIPDEIVIIQDTNDQWHDFRNGLVDKFTPQQIEALIEGFSQIDCQPKDAYDTATTGLLARLNGDKAFANLMNMIKQYES